MVKVVPLPPTVISPLSPSDKPPPPEALIVSGTFHAPLPIVILVPATTSLP